ncbi:MAG: DMT family transporter [Planctomycetota bacterium]|jgi:quaternary ammonium compound-resistance protein SugE
MSWTYLLLASVFEIGWPVGMKISQQPHTRLLGIALAISFMAISGWFLWLAQRDIPIGTSYAVWTGTGAVGTFLIGVIYFGDSASLSRYLGVALIVAGVVVLKASHH